jgi:hypothetical protein
MTRYLLLSSIIALSVAPRAGASEPPVAQCSLEGEWIPKGDVPFSKVTAYYESGMEELCFRHEERVNMLLTSDKDIAGDADFGVRLQTDPDLLKQVDVVHGPNMGIVMGEPAPLPPPCPRVLPATSLSSGILSANTDPLTYSCSFSAGNCDELACTAMYYNGEGNGRPFFMARGGTAADVVEEKPAGLPDCFDRHYNFKDVGIMKAGAASSGYGNGGQVVSTQAEYQKLTGDNGNACIANLDWDRNRLWLIEGPTGTQTEVSVGQMMGGGMWVMSVYDTQQCGGAAKRGDRIVVALPAGTTPVRLERHTKPCLDPSIP